MRVFTVFGAVLAGVAAQRSGDTSYHDGASINKFSIGLADTGVLRAEPETIYSGDIATVYASVAPTAANDFRGVVAFRETTKLWMAGSARLGVNCNPGQNRPVASEGVIYQACYVDGSGDGVGGMIAMDAATGKLLWSWAVPGIPLNSTEASAQIHAITSTMILVTTGPYASPACGGGAVLALRKRDLEVVWRVTKPWAITRAEVVGDRLFLAYHCGDVVALTLASGRTLWARSWSQRTPRTVHSTRLAVMDNTLYVGARGAVRALNIDNGNPVWTYYLTGRDLDISSGPVVVKPPTRKDEEPLVFFGTQGGRLFAIQGKRQALVSGATRAPDSPPVREEVLTAVSRWPAGMPFADGAVAASPDPDVPTFATPAPLTSHGLLYVGTWEGAVQEVEMETGALGEHSWPATGDGAYPLIAADTFLFTRGRQLYNNQLPDIRPDLTSFIADATFWDISLTVTLFGVRSAADYPPLERQYLSVVNEALAAVAPDGASVSRTSAVAARAFVADPDEQGAPPVDFNVTAGVDAPPGVAPVAPAPPPPAPPPAQQPPDMVGTVLPVQVFLLGASPRATVSRLAAEDFVSRIIADMGGALWSGMQLAGSNDVANTFIVPSRVAVSVSGIDPKFNVLPDPTTTSAISGQGLDGARGDGGAGTAAGGGDGDLAAWKIAVIAVAVAIALAALAIAAAFCCCCCRGPCRGGTSPRVSKPSSSARRLGEMDDVATSAKRSSAGGDRDVLLSPFVLQAPARAERASRGVESAGAKERTWTSIGGAASIFSTTTSAGAPGGGAAPRASGTNMSNELLVMPTSRDSSTPSLAGAAAAAAPSRHAKAAAAATANLLCDVGRSAPQQAPALAAAMAGVLAELDGCATAGNVVFEHDYRLTLRAAARSLTPHSVRVQATAPEGGAVEVHLGLRPDLFRNERLLYRKQELRRLFREVKAMAPLEGDGGDGTPWQRWKVVACDGTLRRLLRDHERGRQAWPFLETMRVLGQVSMRLEAMHDLGYAHCNVTAASISWLEASQAWFISDLAHVAPLRSELPLATACLNIRAAAPEVVTAAAEGAARVAVTTAWDAWQLGLLAYELVLGAPLFDADVPAHFVQMMLTDQSPLPWEVSKAKRTAISNSLGPLGPSIMALLERDPVQRMTIREARPLWVEVLRGALAE